ncbi:hypothetical protein PsAD5_03144 [Pseudovibrio sp. Ad5]|uniref:hypothetical protein n=1 Tax=Pseudovibrio sp. Ad5 TaxID=989436 RepID=UPI0007AE7684|nr:hypothetical protein [Pseudovibrio sp. Ad5]KZK93428.1 hypothetical protein PsAD5_03144 [Pseudovibrio sp. Ad5]
MFLCEMGRAFYKRLTVPNVVVGVIAVLTTAAIILSLPVFYSLDAVSSYVTVSLITGHSPVVFVVSIWFASGIGQSRGDGLQASGRTVCKIIAWVTLIYTTIVVLFLPLVAFIGPLFQVGFLEWGMFILGAPLAIIFAEVFVFFLILYRLFIIVPAVIVMHYLVRWLREREARQVTEH